MSPIAIGMDILLAALLIGALLLGWRLNGRLKALRASQLDFAKAVVELDAAAVRAEAGLNALKAAAEEAHDSLLARIDTARSLAQKLEKAEQACEGAARRAEAAADALRTAPPVAHEPVRSLAALREALAPTLSPTLSSAPNRAARPEPDASLPPRPATRRRHVADEALFVEADDVRPSLQGLMRMSLAARR